MKRTLSILVVCTIATIVLVGSAGAQSAPPAELEEREAQLGLGERDVVDAVGAHVAAVAYDEAVVQATATDAFLASLYVEPAPVVRPPSAQGTSSGGGGTTVGECTGFSIPDYIIQRESGGNPSAMNPSGAYGCAQTLLSHYSGGSCSGLDPYTIDGQRACVDILSGGGTNLDPWAQTR